jgi:hypothetical protein
MREGIGCMKCEFFALVGVILLHGSENIIELIKGGFELGGSSCSFFQSGVVLYAE